MSTQPSELLREALSLPPEARAALADSLLGSLDNDFDEDAEDRWFEEIHRRLAEIDGGLVALLPWDQARLTLRSKPRV